MTVEWQMTNITTVTNITSKYHYKLSILINFLAFFVKKFVNKTNFLF